jgi:eukaryotic-like serine/threonine-protein kinase
MPSAWSYTKWRHVLEQCLDSDPEKRWQSARDVKAELEWAAKNNAPAARSKPSFRRALLAGAIAILGLAIVLILVVFPASRPARESGHVEFSVFPPKGTSFPLLTDGAPGPSISPDGRHLAFVALRSNAEQQIWVRPLASSVARPLQGTEGAGRAFWSSDSRSIGYFANGQLWRVDLYSNAVTSICRAPYLGGLAGTWANNVILFSGAGGLYRVSAGGGPATIVMAGSEQTSPTAPSFLPDGRHFLYQAYSRHSDQHQICVGSLDSSEGKCFSTAQSPAKYSHGYLLFIKDQALVAQSFDPDRLAVSGEPAIVSGLQVKIGSPYSIHNFSASSNGTLAYMSQEVQPLVWVDRSGGRLESAGVGSFPAVSRDGRRIAVVRRDPLNGNTDIWIIDRSRGAESRFTFDPSDETSPVFSADGEYLLFGSQRSGTSQLYRKPVSGGAAESLVLSSSSRIVQPDWSADGKFILYQTNDAKTGFDLWAFALQGDRQPFPVARSPHGERTGRFSPDGHWFAYDSTESGPREIWVQPFPPTGSKWQVSTGGGVGPRWRGDGKELFYVAADGMLTAVAIEAGSTFEKGAPRPLFQTMFRGGVYASYTVSHDGKRFLINVPPGVEDVTPITVVMSWPALLRK